MRVGYKPPQLVDREVEKVKMFVLSTSTHTFKNHIASHQQYTFKNNNLNPGTSFSVQHEFTA